MTDVDLTTDIRNKPKAAAAPWQPISTAPKAGPLELRVEADGLRYVLPFPCRRGPAGWINQEMDVPLAVEPIAWRRWDPTERLAERARSAAWPLRQASR